MTTDFVVGKRLRLTRSLSQATAINNYPYYQDLPLGLEGKVTRVCKDTVYFRAICPYSNREITYVVNKDALGEVDPNAPKPRQLGETPAGMIGPDDPRIQWLWEDAAEVASQARHCSEYDALCERLNIPGRMRTFTVKTTVNGIEVSAKIDARSRKQAEDLLNKQLHPVAEAPVV